MPKSDQSLFTWETLFFLAFVLLISYFTYVFRYTEPQALYWDENYFVASAQKYLNGTFFMEPHPPLGKLLIALGERIIDANPIDNQFIGTDYASDISEEFSFKGYRLFPVLLAWLSAPLVFLIFLLLTRRHLFALPLSFVYLFDNALIVHFRGTMLDSTMLFFILLTIFSFLLIREWEYLPRRFYGVSLLFGLALGGAAMTKVLGLIVLLLVPALFCHWWPDWRKFLRFIGTASFAFLIVYIGIWHTHFSLASTINPTLPDDGYYQASEEYKKILSDGRNTSLLSFPVMLRDSWNFLSHYEAGVPQLDLCKADENGSPYFFWPFGARSINYRWETPDSTQYRYLYLQSNPVIWGIGLLGIILSGSLLLCSILTSIKLRHGFLLTTFLGMYIAYMFVMSQLDRVMYLYHYFTPLLFSFFLFGISFLEIRRLGRWVLDDRRKVFVLCVIGFLSFLSFQFYRPLTYYEPLSDDEMQQRSILPFWDLHCVNCEKAHTLGKAKS